MFFFSNFSFQVCIVSFYLDKSVEFVHVDEDFGFHAHCNEWTVPNLSRLFFHFGTYSGFSLSMRISLSYSLVTQQTMGSISICTEKRVESAIASFP